MSKNFILFYLIEGVNQVGNIFTDTLKLKTEKKPNSKPLQYVYILQGSPDSVTNLFGHELINNTNKVTYTVTPDLSIEVFPTERQRSLFPDL